MFLISCYREYVLFLEKNTVKSCIEVSTLKSSSIDPTEDGNGRRAKTQTPYLRARSFYD